MKRSALRLALGTSLSMAALVLVGCGGTEVELSDEGIKTEVPAPTPVKEADPSQLPPGGGGSSSGNAGFNPGASS